VDIHNTVHKFITHPSSSKFQLPGLQSVKWHDKCNELKSYCKGMFQRSRGGNENRIQDMYQSQQWVSWLKFKAFWIQTGTVDHVLWCSVKQVSLQWTVFSRQVVPYSENSFRAPYIIREAKEMVKTSTMRRDTKRVKSGLDLFHPNFLLNPVAPKVDNSWHTAWCWEN